MKNTYKKLGIKTSISEIKSKLDRINRRFKNAEKKLLEHENTD